SMLLTVIPALLDKVSNSGIRLNLIALAKYGLSSLYKHSPRYAAVALFCGAASNAAGAPMLQFTGIEVTVSGNPNENTGFYSFDLNVQPNRFWGIDEFNALPMADQGAVGFGAFAITAGPAQAISIRQVPDGLTSAAESTFPGTERAMVFFHVTGNYT